MLKKFGMNSIGQILQPFPHILCLSKFQIYCVGAKGFDYDKRIGSLRKSQSLRDPKAQALLFCGFCWHYVWVSYCN